MTKKDNSKLLFAIFFISILIVAFSLEVFDSAIVKSFIIFISVGFMHFLFNMVTEE